MSAQVQVQLSCAEEVLLLWWRLAQVLKVFVGLVCSVFVTARGCGDVCDSVYGTSENIQFLVFGGRC